MNEVFLQLAVTAVLSWVAAELHLLRRSVAKRVHYEECNRRMDEHCGELSDLRKQTNAHGERIARLEAGKSRLRA